MPQPLQLNNIDDGLLSLLPMLYVGWADGILTPSEVVRIRERLEEEDWMTASEKERLAEWLDPQNPPDEFVTDLP